MTKLRLSDHYTYKKILLQSIAPILMMICTSLYTVVDGLFISNFSGDDAFAGMNLIAPLMMIVGGLGFMFGSGGAALAGKLLGEKKPEEANKVLGLMIKCTIILISLVGIILYPFVDDLAVALAKISPDTTEKMVADATTYGRVLLLGQWIFGVQTLFHNFFIVNETPNAGFIQTLFAGITNIIFDAIFIVGFKMGVLGAALGTILGYLSGAIYAIVFMCKGKHNLLKIQHSPFDLHVIAKCSTNGLSDFIFNISASIVAIIYNVQLLKYFGQDGLNAYGAIMYISFIFVSIFIGIVIGMGPIISYHYGAKNHEELKSLVKKLLIITLVLGILMVGIAEATARLQAIMFTRTESIQNLTTKAIRLYSLCFVFSGFGILITSIFTSLNNGLISGLISFFRTLIFQAILLFVLPLIFGADSLWWAIVVVEFLSTTMGFIFLLAYRKKYHY